MKGKGSTRSGSRKAATLISPTTTSKGSEAASLQGNAIPVFLIEDHRDPGDSLATMLSAQGLSVIATARNGPEALAQVARLKPKLVLVDAALGDHGSLSLVKAVRKTSPAIRIIVMHLPAVHHDLIPFVRAGVSGFIMKNASPADFVRTVRLVADGVSVLPDVITGKVFSHLASQPGRSTPSRP